MQENSPNVKALPVPSLISVPEGFKNEWIGVVATIVQFVITYNEVLSLDDIRSITISRCFKAYIKTCYVIFTDDFYFF